MSDSGVPIRRPAPTPTPEEQARYDAGNALVDRVFPPEQCDFHPPPQYMPMSGPHNYEQGFARDATTVIPASHSFPPGMPYLV